MSFDDEIRQILKCQWADGIAYFLQQMGGDAAANFYCHLLSK